MKIITLIPFCFFPRNSLNLRQITTRNMEKKEVSIRIPQKVIKTFLSSLPWAVFLTLVVYFTTVKIEQYWKQRYDHRTGHPYEYVNEVYVDVPSFLGNSYSFDPFKKKILGIFNYHQLVATGGIFSSSVEEQEKMPTHIKAATKLSVLFSWKGLRFFVLVFLCVYGCICFYNTYHISLKIIAENQEEKPADSERKGDTTD